MKLEMCIKYPSPVEGSPRMLFILIIFCLENGNHIFTGKNRLSSIVNNRRLHASIKKVILIGQQFDNGAQQNNQVNCHAAQLDLSHIVTD